MLRPQVIQHQPHDLLGVAYCVSCCRATESIVADETRTNRRSAENSIVSCPLAVHEAWHDEVPARSANRVRNGVPSVESQYRVAEVLQVLSACDLPVSTRLIFELRDLPNRLQSASRSSTSALNWSFVLTVAAHRD